jgi:photosystem II stability/assembly factor-like uncharacterized protein
MKIAIVLLCTFFCSTASAQWEKIANFKGLNEQDTFVEEVTCVYFLDLPGPPRVGFAGTSSDLFKTTDGGKSWIHVWGDSSFGGDGYYVTGICFKDSLTGWFSMFGYTDPCYRTTDGGNTWTELSVPYPNYGAISAYYDSGINRLFLGMGDTGTEVSTDLGDTWQFVTSIEAGGFSFWNDSVGIACAYPTDSTSGIMRTTDGGLIWNVVDTVACGVQPLAILGTPTCFESDNERIIIRRSDDYGQTWRVIKDFGPNSDCTGIIRGDTTRLYIQMDSSMYVSTDQGITWFNDGGPGSMGDVGAHDGIFYSAKGVSIVGSTTLTDDTGGMHGTQGIVEGGGLWEEIWPTAGVAESGVASSNNGISVFPNPASDELQIMGSQPGEVHLFDLMGRERMNAVTNGTGATLDVSHLEDGMYFLRSGSELAKVEIAH